MELGGQRIDLQSYIDNLQASFEPTWQALLDVGLCTAAAVADARAIVVVNLSNAIEKARQEYRSQPAIRSGTYGLKATRSGWSACQDRRWTQIADASGSSLMRCQGKFCFPQSEENEFSAQDDANFRHLELILGTPDN